jgi:hypothetical protein
LREITGYTKADMHTAVIGRVVKESSLILTTDKEERTEKAKANFMDFLIK